MHIFDSLQEFSSVYSQCVATIGKYDGMHLGHQHILREVMEKAKELNLPSVVILSEPQPEEFFSGDKAPPRLTHFADKVLFLESMGIDAVFILKFDQSLSELSADKFVKDYLVDGLGLKALIVGHDFGFGHKRSGNIATLVKAGEKFGFEVDEVSPQHVDGDRISSTLVREYLQQGDCTKVKNLLGRPYSISGKVMKGRQLGRTLGFPTANIAMRGNKSAITGVFVVRVKLHDSKEFSGIANIGSRPTVDNSSQVFLEVHLFDFEADIYEQNISVNFVFKIRDEIKFENLESLKAQIAQDVEVAKQWQKANDE